MEGAEGTQDAAGKLIFSNLPFLGVIFLLNKTHPWCLALGNCRYRGLQGRRADWFVLVCFGLAGGLVCLRWPGQA